MATHQQPDADRGGDAAGPDETSANDGARSDDARATDFTEADGPAPGEAGEAARPTDADDDLTAAVRAAQAGPYVPSGRFEPPRSIPMLILVLALMVGMGVYGLVWTRNLAARNERIRLRTLEERAVKYAEQERFVRANGYLPAGREAKPLDAAERAELQALRDAYGSTRAATTQPSSTRPASTGASTPAAPAVVEAPPPTTTPAPAAGP